MSKSLELICDINLIHVKLDSALKRSQPSPAFQHRHSLSVPAKKDFLLLLLRIEMTLVLLRAV